MSPRTRPKAKSSDPSAASNGGHRATAHTSSLHTLGVQRQVVIGKADDPYEREADRVSDHVMSGQIAPAITPLSIGGLGNGSVQRQEEENEEPIQRQEEEEVHTKEGGSPGSGTGGTTGMRAASQAIRSSGPGHPLGPGVRRRLEQSMGRDFSGVRVHTDGSSHHAANALHARAFTHGNHIWLGKGESPNDLGLMAHESAHVVQQEGTDQVQRECGVDESCPEEMTGSASPNSLASIPNMDATMNIGPNSETPATSSSSGSPNSNLPFTLSPEIESIGANGVGPASPEPDVIESSLTPNGEEDNSEIETEAEIAAANESEEVGAEAQTETERNEVSTEEEVTSEAAGDPGSGEIAESELEENSESLDAPAAEGLDLINFELAEHERWAGSFGEMGTAGSDQRAQFLLDQAGQGAVSGAEGGAKMGFVMGAVGAGIGQIAGRRLAALAVSRGFAATPIPGLGSAIGGVMAVAGLAMRDWGDTANKISRFGTGEGYEGLANDLESIAEALDVATQIMDVLAGVLGVIAVGMWVAAVLSAGALSPLAAVLSAIAIGINLATTAIGIIINVAVRPTVTALACAPHF